MTNNISDLIITQKDKDECLSLFLQSSLDRVYLHNNGKKLWGSIRVLKYRRQVGLSDDIQCVLNPESLRRGTTGYHRKKLIDIDRLHFHITHQIMDILLASKHIGKDNFALKNGIYRVIEPFLKGKTECAAHCAIMLDRIKDECQRLQATGEIKKQFTSAQRVSALRKLRPRLVAAVEAGLEKNDVLELWDTILVGHIMKG